MNILFWNLKRHNLKKHIKTCLIEKQIDIAIFAEHDQVDFHELTSELDSHFSYIEGMGGCEKLALIVASGVTGAVRREQNRYAIYSLKHNSIDYILVGVHLQDRINADTAQRIETISRLKNDIQNLEDSSRCKRTIIVGDFNANPYDPELLQMNAFNAVLFKELIKKSETRTVDSISYRRFYNPTLLSLTEEGQNYGSFYYSNGSAPVIWNCLDQILVSKSLADNVKSVRYLKKIGTTSLVRSIIPNKDISDHLPLFVELD